MRLKRCFLVGFVSIVLLVSVLSAGIILSAGGTEDEKITILVQNRGMDVEHLLASSEYEVLQEYHSFSLVETSKEGFEYLSTYAQDIDVDSLDHRNELNVKGYRFDTTEGYPELDPELTIDGYEPGTLGLYLVDMMGPVDAEWREILESKGVEIINYVPNYAYEVRMTPELSERVERLDFVDWVGVYQPGFKLAQDIQPGPVTINMVDGTRIVTEIEERSELVEIANMNDVYYVSNHIEPQLHDEMATQIVGGGCWFMDDEDDDPDTAYRLHGDYGSYMNQIGYKGEGVVTAIADTGIGDGTEGDAGHPDFTGRVLGGYSFSGGWDDGHGHGTHCTGSAAGDTHHGTGSTVYEDYYSGQGSAPETELFAVKIFDGGGGWIGPEEDYTPIVTEARDRSNAYVHSNSWGAGTAGAYTESDEDFDAATRDAGDGEPMVIVVATGNSGPGSNTVGSPAVGKNVISVGSTNNYDGRGGTPEEMAGSSSRGWTNDNRIKPDVVAPGNNIESTMPGGGYGQMSGTSMATPAVSGAAAVTVEWYETNHGHRPSPAMVRGLLINTANDIDGPGPIPNQAEGWGIVDISKLEYPLDDPVPFMLEDQESLITTGDTNEYQMQVDREDEPLKITLTWIDKEAEAGDESTLKNDLNLEVEAPNGDVYRGNAFDNGWSLPDTDAIGDFDDSGDGWDDSNNVENVYIHQDDVEMGTYTVRVIGADVPEDSNNDGQANQDYALIGYNVMDEIPGDPPEITITRPDGGEVFHADTEEDITWTSSEGEDSIDSVSLFYSSDDGGSWTEIASDIEDRGEHTWLVPNVMSDECLIRATIRDDVGREGEDVSGHFEMIGIPPEPPRDLQVDHHGEGDVDNIITWSPSPDDPDDVSDYNIYRSEDRDGPWDEATFVESLEADGSNEYEFVDEDKGLGDDIFWWYVVRATNEDMEEDNEDSVQEPGAPPAPLPPEDPEPGDDAVDVSTEVELSVLAEHEDDDPMEVSFYDALDDSEIGTDDVASGERASVLWTGLEYETSYEWYAVADDGEFTARSDTWTFTTMEEPEAYFEVEILDHDAEVGEGNDVTVQYAVTNTGDEEDTQEIEFLVDGTLEDSEEITLPSDGTHDGEFVWGAKEQGTYSLMVTSEDTDDEVTVEVFEPAFFEVEITSYDDEVVEGENVVVDYKVTNTGGAPDTQSVEFSVNGALEESEEVTLGAGDEYEETFVWDTEGYSGNFDMMVTSDDDSDEVTVQVLEEAYFEVEIEGYDEEVEMGEDLVVEYVVTNTGDIEGTQDVEFLVDDGEVDSDEVTLDGGDEYQGTFVWTTDEGGVFDLSVLSEDDSDEVTVTVLEPAFFEVEVDIPEEVVQGEPLIVDYSVTNAGDVEETQEIEFEVYDGDDLIFDDSEEITLGGTALASEDVYNSEFIWTPEEPGEYEVVVSSDDHEESFELTVLRAAYFEVSIISPGDGDEFDKGEEITIGFNVTNTGDVQGTYSVELYVDDEYVDTIEGSLDPEEVYQGEFTWEAEEDGEFEFNLRCGESDEFIQASVREPEDDTDDSFPWWIILVLLLIVGIILVVILVMRRGDEEEEEDIPPPDMYTGPPVGDQGSEQPDQTGVEDQVAPSAGSTMPAPETEEKEEVSSCSTCGNELSYIDEYDRWYCYECEEYQ